MFFKKKFTSTITPFFYYIASVYTILNLGGSLLEIPSTVFLGVFFVTVVYSFFKTLTIPLGKKGQLQFIVCLPLIIANCFYSIDFFNSTIYWLLWLMFITTLIKVSKTITQAELAHLTKHIPYILLTASILLYIIMLPHFGRSFSTKNSLGLLAGGTLIAALSIHETWRKWLVIGIAFFILAQSDSRSSLAFGVGIAALYFVYSVNSKNSPLYALGIIIILFFQGDIYAFAEQKMLKKELYASNLAEAVESAQKERTDLLLVGWELFKERPYIGFGLKSKYQEGRIKGDIHVHNGYLSTLIETGLIISFLVIIVLIKLFSRLVQEVLAKGGDNNSVWLFFIGYGLIRSYGENYLFFNIGNIFSILFLFFCILILNDASVRLIYRKNKHRDRIYTRNRRHPEVLPKN